MVDFRKNLRNKAMKYKKLYNNSRSTLEKKEGGRGIENIFKTGSTRFNTLFKISKILNTDIRNFLIFNEKTHVFKNTFNTFDEFYTYIRLLYKKIRNERGLKARDILKKIGNISSNNQIYDFESEARGISIEKFYKYLDAIEITSDEFFLMDQEYEVIDNQVMNEITEITIEDFNNRVYELEKIKGRKINSRIFTKQNNFQTLHIFLRVCKGLRINPKDFFDFNKKDFNEDFKIIDISNSANYIKHKLELGGFKVQRCIKLDSVFLFCSENSIPLSDLFDFTRDVENIRINNIK